MEENDYQKMEKKKKKGFTLKTFKTAIQIDTQGEWKLRQLMAP